MRLQPLLSKTRNNSPAFTLVEVVSAALIVIVLGFLLTTVNQTQRVITGTTSRVNQFQSSRVAFEALTRTLSQATLNTYWDMDYDANANPTNYRRQSDMHFYSGPMSGLLSTSTTTGPKTYPGHGVFFQAPLGYTAKVSNPTNPKTRYNALTNALNVVGYYVEWNDGLKYSKVPKFIRDAEGATAGARYRFRLMQTIQPTESVMVYNNTNYTQPSSSGKSPFKNATDWIKVATGRLALPTGLDVDYTENPKDHSRVLADNVVALLILPKLAEKDRATVDDSGLTSNYTYDTRPQIAYDAVWKNNYNLTTALTAEQKKQVNQLPPVLQVVMVAIDEPSGAKLEEFSVKKDNKEAYEFCKDLFKAAPANSSIKISNFLADIGEDKEAIGKDTLAGRLLNVAKDAGRPVLNYRIFSADVQIRGAKWSKIY
jgi:uncharacterized protein (TIGR02599 family)